MLSLPDRMAALRRTALFGVLDENVLGILVRQAIEVRVQRGETLFIAGDEARGLYVIVDGAVRAFRENLDGREQVIHVEGPGATLAEAPVFDGGAYPSTVAAEEDAVLLFLDKRDVRRVCLEHPEVALAALKVLAGRLRKAAELIEALSLHEVDQRLARFLLDEARLGGLRTAQGLSIELVLTNQQMASRIGTVREVISRAIQRLQHNGLIAMDGRQLTIRDEKALASYAGK
jgi:CRP-like cAMP-binding protein